MKSNTARTTESAPVEGGRITAAQLSRLVSDHLDVVWRLALYLSGETTAAENLVERCTQLSFARRSTLVSSIGFKPWFLGLVVESWMQSAPRSLRLAGNLEASLGDAYQMAESAGFLEASDPPAAILERVTPADVCDALARLPAEDLVVVALSLADDLSYRELGLVLALSAETVRIRLHRGRALLKVAIIQQMAG